jgi:hypothetical protein
MPYSCLARAASSARSLERAARARCSIWTRVGSSCSSSPFARRSRRPPRHGRDPQGRCGPELAGRDRSGRGRGVGLLPVLVASRSPGERSGPPGSRLLNLPQRLLRRGVDLAAPLVKDVVQPLDRRPASGEARQVICGCCPGPCAGRPGDGGRPPRGRTAPATRRARISVTSTLPAAGVRISGIHGVEDLRWADPLVAGSAGLDVSQAATVGSYLVDADADHGWRRGVKCDRIRCCVRL